MENRITLYSSLAGTGAIKEGQVKNALANASSKIAEGTKAVESANPQKSADKIRGYGDQIADIAGEMPGYADEISDYSKKVGANAEALNGNGIDWLNLGNDALKMDGSNSPLVSEMLRSLGMLDPNKRVTEAGQDVSDAYDASSATLDRNLSRQGVNPTSGRSQWLRQLETVAKNAAIAGMMNRQRDASNKAYQTAVSTYISQAQSLANQGKDALVSGSALDANAAGLVGQAAGIKQVGAQLQASASSLEQSAANLELGYAQQMATQKDKEAAVDTAEANYYASLEKSLISAEVASWSAPRYVTTFDEWSAHGTHADGTPASVTNPVLVRQGGTYKV